jgi:DNA-binding IclR family transcriptional regulator
MARKINTEEGTRAIERAATLLRQVAASGNEGLRLSEIAAECNLPKSTAHRILSCLVREKLLKQHSRNARYSAGRLLFELGISYSACTDFQHLAKSKIEALAKSLGGTAFLNFRSGDESVTVIRAGHAGLLTRCAYPGQRRPMVTCSGGTAILAALPRDEAEATINRNLAALRGYTDSRIKSIRAMVDRSLATGISVSSGAIVSGMNAFGVALRDSAGKPWASIAVAAPAQVLSLKHHGEIRRAMAETAQALEAA